MSKNIKLNIKIIKKGSNPSIRLIMMRTVMAAQRDTVVAIQICWEQYLHNWHGSHLDLVVSLSLSWFSLSTRFSLTFTTDTTTGWSGVSLELLVTSVDTVVFVSQFSEASFSLVLVKIMAFIGLIYKSYESIVYENLNKLHQALW